MFNGDTRFVLNLRVIATVMKLIFSFIFTAASILAADSPALSSLYPGDKDIQKDPSVLFAEDFENGDFKKWDETRGGVSVTNTAPNSGKYAAEMNLVRGKNDVADAIKWFMPGADTIYTRFYVKFAADYQYPHHFVTLLANERTNRWSAFGKAGMKPNGTYFSTGMETWFAWGKNPPPGELHLYSYFLDMERDQKMDKYWGNSFFAPGPGKGVAASEQRIIPKLDQWQCWEFMIQANTREKSDGRQAMWLDGKLVGEFVDIRWRNKADLKITALWLQHYGFDSGDPTKQYWKQRQTVWFDDVVVATRYIGPIHR